MFSGRPVGVVLDRMPGLNEACVTLSYAEVPTPYSGDTSISVMAIFNGQITYIGAANNPNLQSPANPNNTPSTDVGWLGTIRVGDVIRFGYRGSYFQFQPNGILPSSQQAYDQTTGFYNQDPCQSNYHWQLGLLSGSTASIPANGFYNFQIVRAPVKMAAGSVQLPGTAVIDLDFSGFDVGDSFVLSSGMHISPWVSTYSFQPIWPWAGVAQFRPATPLSALASRILQVWLSRSVLRAEWIQSGVGPTAHRPRKG